MRARARSRVVLLVALATALTISLTGAFPVPASADPIAEKRAEADRIARELATRARQASQLTEDLNEARLAATAAEQEAVEAQAEMRRTEELVQRAEGALRSSAVQTYVRGGLLPLSTHGADAADQLEISVRQHYMRVVASRQADALATWRDARDRLAEQQAVLDAATSRARLALASVQERGRAAAAAADAQRALHNRAQGELAALVETEQRRRAEAEARRVAAELAARQTRPASTPARSNTDTNSNTNSAASPPAAGPASAPKGAAPPSSGAAAAVEEAKRQLGKPYQWGGSGPDTFDCSGLTAWAWRAAGKSLPHSSRAQYSATGRVDISEIQPGDLVFFGNPIHHVGIYAGNGQMINAPETGRNVSYASIHRRDLVGVGRVY